MKIGAISMLNGIPGKERIQMLQEFKAAYDEQKVKQVAASINLADKPLQITVVEQSLQQQSEELSLVVQQDHFLGSPVIARNQEPDLKTLAQLDKISQNMLQDLGAFEEPTFTMPPLEKKIASASSTIAKVNGTEIPPPKPHLFQAKPINIFDQTEPLSVPKPSQPIPTNIETAILEIPVDHSFSPNRKDALPPHKLPADISYVYDAEELEQLEKSQETQMLLQGRREQEVFEAPRSEEDVVPPSSLYQPLDPQGPTKIPAVENPEELMIPGNRNAIQELQRTMGNDILMGLSTTKV